CRLSRAGEGRSHGPRGLLSRQAGGVDHCLQRSGHALSPAARSEIRAAVPPLRPPLAPRRMGRGGERRSGRPLMSLLTPAIMRQRAVEQQRGAADPQKSVWVVASAGTGKTTVLTDRCLRLLLAGSRPERLLCLTFTKAAAAEMANRIAERLAHWAVLDEAALAAALTELLGRAPSDEQRDLARRLFARVLDTPGGMRILTIHAFCQS